MLACPQSAFRPDADADPTCTLAWIARQLGVSRLSNPRLAAYVEGLIRDHAFPRPLPAPLRGGGITAAVTRHSTWRRVAVEAWLADWLPPEAMAMVDDAAARAAAAEMDAAAHSLRLINGGRA